MSAAAARSARPAARVGQPAARVGQPAARSLRLVTARRSTAARAPFVAVVLVTLTAGLLGLLALNTVLAQDAFRLHLLQLQGRRVADQEQSLQREVAALQSPAVLAARAAALGMVPGGPPAFLRLSDGKVLGAAVPGPATGPGTVAPAGSAAGPGRTAAPGSGSAGPGRTAAPGSGSAGPAGRTGRAGSAWVLLAGGKPAHRQPQPRHSSQPTATASGPGAHR